MPEEYFRHTGYSAKKSHRPSVNGSEKNVPSQVSIRERFNEKLDYAASVKSKKDEALSAFSRGPVST